MNRQPGDAQGAQARPGQDPWATSSIAIEGLKKTGGEGGEVLRKAIEAGTFTTPIGAISFNDLHEVKKDVQVQIVKGKAFHRHSVISDPVVLAPPTKAK